MVKFWELAYKISNKHPWVFGKIFHTILAIIFCVIFYHLDIKNRILNPNIDYANYSITVVSIMIGFYLANMFIISGSNADSIIGRLPKKTKKELFSHNSSAINYALILIFCYLFTGNNILVDYFFLFLIFCNFFAAFRIYLLMYLFARADLN